MKRIRLFCAEGITTSFLLTSMREAAKNYDGEFEIEAFPESEMEKHLEQTDLAMLGPHVKYRYEIDKGICQKHNIPIVMIPEEFFGVMNGKEIFKFALEQIKNI